MTLKKRNQNSIVALDISALRPEEGPGMMFAPIQPSDGTDLL
jgi:hypothetical protein